MSNQADHSSRELVVATRSGQRSLDRSHSERFGLEAEVEKLIYQRTIVRTLRRLGKRLNDQHMVDGQVSRDGNVLRLTLDAALDDEMLAILDVPEPEHSVRALKLLGLDRDRRTVLSVRGFSDGRTFGTPTRRHEPDGHWQS
jgi:hypothetical protein